MVLVTIDQKWRIRLPKKVQKSLGLKRRQSLDLAVRDKEILISKVVTKPGEITDPVLRDMIERPLHTKVKITRELLEKLKEEQWLGQ